MPVACKAEDRSQQVADMLERIPRSDEDGSPLHSLCPMHDPADAACSHCQEALACVLQIFDAIQILPGTAASGPKVKASSETALYFLRSLAAYVRRNLKLVSNWEREGAAGGHSVLRAFSSGAQFLYLMERKRVIEHRDDTPTRKLLVSQAFITAKVRGKRELVYLMQYDDRAMRYQLIGGRRRPTDKDALATMVREIQEELGGNQLTYGQNYELRELISDLTLKELSRSYGAYTEYHFTIYHATIDQEQLALGPNDRWVSYPELMSGRTKSGVTIIIPEGVNYFRSMDEQLDGGIRGLRPSLRETQRRPLREILRERKWEIVALVLAIAGLAATVAFGMQQIMSRK